MLTIIFANIGYFLTGLYVVTAIFCIGARSPHLFSSAILLGLLTATAWIDSLWNDPANMSVAHLAILACMLLTIHGKFASLKIWTMFLMLVSDVVWVWMPHFNFSPNELNFPYSLFWWQSILNILFIFQCFFTLGRCYYSRYLTGKSSNASFYARSIEESARSGGAH